MLSDFRREKDFLLCVDSDGCVFDTMEIKHKECFCPATILHFSLQPVSKYAREAAEFVNLYSQTRGIHRLPALIRVMDLLAKRREVRERGFEPPRLSALRGFVASAPVLNHAAMLRWQESGREDPERRTVVDWSSDVNRRIEQMVRGIPPFPFARDSLRHAASRADIVVVSATPESALEREWEENGIRRYASLVCGQERGSKKEIIGALGRLYEKDRMLMVGDAPGDRAAAVENGIPFYPIRPDQEAQSWREFIPAADRFFGGSYRGAFEQALTDRFEGLLPAEPGWDTVT